MAPPHPLDQPVTGPRDQPHRALALQVLLTPPGPTQLQMHIVGSRTEIVQIRLTGGLDRSNAAYAADLLNERFAPHTRLVTLDLSGLHLCDWAGIALIIWARNQQLTRGGSFNLIGSSRPVVQLLAAGQLHQLLTAPTHMNSTKPRPARGESEG